MLYSWDDMHIFSSALYKIIWPTTVRHILAEAELRTLHEAAYRPSFIIRKIHILPQCSRALPVCQIKSGLCLNAESPNIPPDDMI